MRFFSLRKKKYATLTVRDSEQKNTVIEKEKEAIKEEISELWEKCPECGEITIKKDIGRNLKKCPHCDFYYGADN